MHSGTLQQVGSDLFQSPLSFYSAKRQWDVAPGYEDDPAPDFTRPVTAECLACHSGEPKPLQNTLNSYANPPFRNMAITCAKCHGNSEAHLKNPIPGTIINPAKLAAPARDSICEQCHLSGETRVPNPGRHITDFIPGERLEDNFTIYVAGSNNDGRLR